MSIHVASALPARFHLWWAVSTLGSAGSAMLSFAVIWLATGHGAGAVALVSTLSVLPPVVLLLLGGVLGDRHGPRRLLTRTSSAQCLSLLALLVIAQDDTGVLLLAAIAATTSVISALQQPAALVYPRLLIAHEDQLARALARISGSVSAARILGVAAGGALIAAVPLQVVLAANLLIAGFFLVVLRALRPRAAASPPGSRGSDGGVWSAVVDGIRSARALRIGPLLGAVALVCSAVMPVVAVVLPSSARAQGWSATQASLLESSWAGGMLSVTLLISVTGTLARPRLALVGGPLVIAIALVTLALPLDVPWALGTAAVLGAGTALFTTHIAPALLRRAPAGQMARFQSLMALVQLAPAALLNGAFAALAGSECVVLAFLLAAGLAGGAAVMIARVVRESAEILPA